MHVAGPSAADMQFPKLSPLQSRFAASLGASFILLLIYLSLTQPHFAYAIELDSRIPSDHNHPIIYDFGFDNLDEGDTSEGDSIFQNDIEKRQTAGLLYLRNNEPQNKNIVLGDVQNWVFTAQSVNGAAGERGRGLPRDDQETSKTVAHRAELKKRQSAKPVYITLNTCSQPISTSNTTTMPPQLLLYWSQSNTRPGPGSLNDVQNLTLDSGYAMVNITSSTDIYVGVAAVNGTGFIGYWSYEIAISIDEPYHSFSNDTFLHFVDADTHSALFITDNLTQMPPNSTVYQRWMSEAPPFGLFGHDQKDPSILGVSKSYCGLMHSAKIMANLQGVKNQNVASMTTRGLGAKPKEQFYVTSLNASASYWGFMAMQGNSTASGLNVVGGGGKVWAAINFTTKAESNCALMYNLTFCSEIAYAVPTNPDRFSPRDGLPQLAKLYDGSAQKLYQYFNYSLQQIPCNTSASAQYSLARNCDDCARAYKQWLCAVTIPRCEDFGNPAPYLKPRNVAQKFPNGTTLGSTLESQFLWTLAASNQSRNGLIDAEISPGPYKEVLPCDDLCYDLVQSCPAALGFGCPLSGAGLEDSYGFRSGSGSEITCSWLGAAYYLSAGTRVGFVIGMKVAVGLVFWLGYAIVLGI